MTNVERFNAKWIQVGSCWEWQEGKDRDGYGVFWWGKYTSKAHRFSYLEKYGSLPPVVMHTCDNPSCVNPDHLVGGTHRDNQIDKHRKGRTAIGVSNGGGGKLSESQVKKIDEIIRNTNKSDTEIAESFPCGRTTIWAIRNGKLWRHITS